MMLALIIAEFFSLTEIANLSASLPLSLVSKPLTRLS